MKQNKENQENLAKIQEENERLKSSNEELMEKIGEGDENLIRFEAEMKEKVKKMRKV